MVDLPNAYNRVLTTTHTSSSDINLEPITTNINTIANRYLTTYEQAIRILANTTCSNGPYIRLTDQARRFVLLTYQYVATNQSIPYSVASVIQNLPRNDELSITSSICLDIAPASVWCEPCTTNHNGDEGDSVKQYRSRTIPMRDLESHCNGARHCRKLHEAYLRSEQDTTIDDIIQRERAQQLVNQITAEQIMASAYDDMANTCTSAIDWRDSSDDDAPSTPDPRKIHQNQSKPSEADTSERVINPIPDTMMLTIRLLQQ